MGGAGGVHKGAGERGGPAAVVRAACSADQCCGQGGWGVGRQWVALGAPVSADVMVGQFARDQVGGLLG